MTIISRAIPFLSKVLPIGMAVKGLEKIDPRLGAFMSGAFGAGYTSEQVLDFLRDKFQNPENLGVKNRLEQGSAQGTLRPDEKASLKSIREAQQIPNAIGSAITGGAAIAGGLGALKNLKDSQSAIGGAISPSQILGPEAQSPAQISGPPNRPLLGGPSAQAKPGAPTQSPKQPIQPSPGIPTGGATPFDFLAQYNPHLAQTLLLNVQHGIPPEKAALNLKNVQQFQRDIDQIENDVGTSFEDFVSQAFGGGRKNASKSTQAQKSTAQQSQQGMHGQQANVNFQARMDQQKAILEALKNLRQGNG